ncbi:MAG: zinc-binding dehydrogenase [Planctomycetota bacterium]|jgi:NADPH:quinone reductase-like Zn-dependent oxidoreductase
MNAAVITHQAAEGDVASSWECVADWPEPAVPERGEARIRVEASAFNQMDLWVSKGVPGLELEYPRISGCDACGVVESVGHGVDESWVGKRVIFNAAQRLPERVHPDDPTGATLAPSYELLGEHHHGAHCEVFNCPVASLRDVGEADPCEAAAFGLVALTAYGMVRKAGVRPGQHVLITGIGGGVSNAALSICKWLGCVVVVTSRHQWKLDRALELGADQGILDDGEDWSRRARAWTRKRGFDVCVDSIGRPVHMSCIKSLARGGCFVTCGSTAGPRAETNLAYVFWNQLRLLGSTMGTSDEFAEICALFRAGHVGVQVDEVFAWDRAPEAVAKLERGEQMGKIVLRWN